MLLGMPVLASSVGGVNSLIKHNEIGFLFNPYDAYELAGLILDLSIDYNKALDAGKKARATALKRHDAKSIEESISNMYKAIIRS
jgi:glycosyltransferase involved in cell wall biosynthesis